MMIYHPLDNYPPTPIYARLPTDHTGGELQDMADDVSDWMAEIRSADPYHESLLSAAAAQDGGARLNQYMNRTIYGPLHARADALVDESLVKVKKTVADISKHTILVVIVLYIVVLTAIFLTKKYAGREKSSRQNYFEGADNE